MRARRPLGAPSLSYQLMIESPARFPVRVYWEDTDAGGIVYHSNYLKYMERARSDLLRRLGVSQQAALSDPDGLIFVAASVSIRYRKGAQLDDDLEVRTRATHVGRASIVFEQNVWRGDELLTEGEVRVGAVSRRTMAPAPMPPDLYEAVKAFEQADRADEG